MWDRLSWGFKSPNITITLREAFIMHETTYYKFHFYWIVIQVYKKFTYFVNFQNYFTLRLSSWGYVPATSVQLSLFYILAVLSNIYTVYSTNRTYLQMGIASHCFESKKLKPAQKKLYWSKAVKRLKLFVVYCFSFAFAFQ